MLYNFVFIFIEETRGLNELFAHNDQHLKSATNLKALRFKKPITTYFRILDFAFNVSL